MSERLPVKKTYKLYIGGTFPRSESGRTYEAEGQNVARASRKDVRDAVRAARGAQPGWAAATAYNRGQVLYRLAEMVEARVAEFAELCSGRDEVERSIDRIVWYAGWADKLPQVLGGSNPVAGPYFNFTVPEPTGVVAVLAPSEPALLGLVTRVLPPLVGGNAVVAVASEARPLAAIELAEGLATSDVPGGVVNLLTGQHAELAPVLASHMDVNAIDLGGAFPRSESGRTYEAQGQNVARGSRKDARDAVRAARAAQPKWAAATAYNRGQVLYRLAEMVESRVPELADLCAGREEVERSIDRIVWYAGWADKLSQVLGGSNPVAGPYFNFTVPEPTGVVAVLAPDEPSLLGLVTRLLPPLVGGNAVVAVASETKPLAAIELAEAIATSDLPGGVVNLLTGYRKDMAPILAAHMDVNAIDVCGADGSAPELEQLAAENVKRVVHGRPDSQSPWEIASFLELKTVWHPVGQ